MSKNSEGKFQIKLELKSILTDPESCQTHLENNLNTYGFTSCKIYSKVIEIILEPPTNFSDEYILQTIDDTLKEIGIQFVKGVIRQYVGNVARTLVASATGGALGSRGGPAGMLVGLLAGAVIEKALFDWKNVCECTHDEFGNLIINYFDGDKI